MRSYSSSKRSATNAAVAGHASPSPTQTVISLPWPA